jgi:hypothetical protein
MVGETACTLMRKKPASPQYEPQLFIKRVKEERKTKKGVKIRGRKQIPFNITMLING